MPTYHPLKLAGVLEDLDQRLSNWSMRASAAISAASQQQRLAEEHIERAQKHARLVENQAVEDREAVTQQQQQIDTLLGLAQDSVSTAKKTLAEVTAALQKAQTTLKLWQAELAKAQKWLRRAEERLRRALEELRRAQAELQAARNELSSAESDLRSCQNDDSRKNCSGPRRRVEQARARVEQARAWVAEAQREVNDARDEVARAKARVQCCQTAIAHANQAISLANQAKQRANSAISTAERTLEYGRAADRQADQADKCVTEEEREAEQMMMQVQRAARDTAEGRTHYQKAERAEESAQRFSRLASRELDSRISHLHQANRTWSGLGGGGGGGVSAGSSATARAASPKLSGADVLAMSTFVSALSSFFGGGHGYKYRKTRQEYLRSRPDDPNEPRYVRGWIKQEMRRLDQIKQAKREKRVHVDAEGRTFQGPGGDKRNIRGIPGLHVGHRYPDIDVPENYRLELPSMNSARPGIARRLGIEYWR
jgi:hypothetical protein